jgi:hypothetical protein
MASHRRLNTFIWAICLVLGGTRGARALTQATIAFGSQTFVASAFAARFSIDYLPQGLCASSNGTLITFKLKSGTFGLLNVYRGTKPIYVLPFPYSSSGFTQPPTVSAGGPYNGFINVPISLNGSVSGTDGEPLSYAWSSSPERVSSTQQNPVVTFPSAGTYTLSLSVSEGPIVTYATTTATIVTSTPLVKVIPLTNTGNAPLTIQSMSVSGTYAKDFTLDANTCPDPGSLAIGNSCSIKVTLSYKGLPESANLIIQSNSPASVVTIPLSVASQ